MSARLVVQQGPTPNHEYHLADANMTIGRSADNEIVINDAEVSRRHARILFTEGPDGDQYLFEDFGSTNGSFINGLRCTNITPLVDGDVVELGDSIRLLFVRTATEIVAVDESEFDTADLPPFPPAQPVITPSPQPQPPAASSRPAPLPLPPEPSQTPDEHDWDEGKPRFNRKRLAIGCGCAALILLCLCTATVFFLDSYQQGQLLYCGGLRPLFETILGPVGFSPICP
ncbi:MAG: FHA domain-containing protein [Chloroflexi bacterium]|nr:FHA domain-containing protein [Chloroflexota bacterium]